MKNDAYFSIMHALHGLTMLEAGTVLSEVRQALRQQAAQTRVDEATETAIDPSVREADREFWQRFTDTFGTSRLDAQ